MRRRFIAAAAAAVAFLAAVASFDRVPAPGPLGDEATEALMVASLAHDHDLRFDAADLERSYSWFTSGPRGLALGSADGGVTRRFARSPVFAVVAWPWYAVFGPRGILLLNALLCVALAGFAWRLRGAGGDSGGLYAIGFVIGSAALGYALRFGSHLFEFACVFGALGLWWRSRPRVDGVGPARRESGVLPFVAAGVLFALAAALEPLALLPATAVVIDLARARAARAAVFAASVLVVWGTLAGGSGAATAGFERRVFPEPEALDRGADGWKDGL